MGEAIPYHRFNLFVFEIKSNCLMIIRTEFRFLINDKQDIADITLYPYGISLFLAKMSLFSSSIKSLKENR